MIVSLYSITHRESGREYIGITSRRPAVRWYHHEKRDSHIGRALRKYGAAAFDFKVETTVDTWLEGCALECAYIAQRRPAFNQTIGGDGRFGHKASAETRAKMSAKSKGRCIGRKASPETLAKMRAARLGKKQSAEAVAKTAAANTGRTKSPETRAKIAAKAVGRKHTPEARAKIKAARLAQGTPPRGVVTEETRANMRAAHLGRKHSEETKAKRAASLKRAYAEGRKQPVRGLPRGADGRILPKARNGNQ